MNDLHPDLAQVVVSTEQIQSRVKELADQISADFTNGENLYLVGILKGAFMFLADLVRQINIPTVVDFMAISHFGDNETAGEVRIVMDLSEPIVNKHVIVVEDIVDTGKTLAHVLEEFEELGAKSLEVVTLLHKPSVNKNRMPLRYVGFDIPNKFVVGYGLDYNGYGRNLKEIYKVVEQEQS